MNNNVFYPGGQPYTPPRGLTDELIEVRSQMLACAEGIRVLLDKAILFLLDEDDPPEIVILKMLRAASDLSNLQSRLRVLSRERAELEEVEET